MGERMRITEEELVGLLTSLGERWRKQLERPLTHEEKKRAYAAVARALARIVAEGRPSLRERLARWWGVTAGQIRSLGVVLVEGLWREPAFAFADTEEGTSWSGTARSDDGRLRGTLLVTAEQEVWVGFETEDPDLAGAVVHFAILSEEREEPLHQGQVVLEPVEEGIWEGRAYLGRVSDLGLSETCELVFAVLEPTGKE